MPFFRLAVPALFLAALAACTDVVIDPPEVATCKAAVSAAAGTGGTPALVSNESLIDGRLVTLRDSATGTNWNCILDASGAVEQVDIAS